MPMVSVRGSRIFIQSVYHYFNLWSKARLCENDFYAAVTARQPVWGFVVVDTSFIKNVFGRDVTGRNPTDRGRQATKISLLTDRRGTPLCSVFHKANKRDALTLKHLLDTHTRRTNQLQAYDTLLADKGYDSATCRTTCEVRNLLPRIPKSGTKDTYKGRYVSEQTFGMLDKFRRIRVRYEMSIRNFKSFHFMAMLIILHGR